MSSHTPAPARFITARRTAWLVALLPLLAAIAVMTLLGEAERDQLATDQSPEGADSTSAIELAERLPDEGDLLALVLWTASEGELTDAQLGELQGQAGELLSSAGGEQGQGGEQDGPPGAGQGESPLIVSEDRTAAFLPVPVASDSNTENIDKVEDLRAELRDQAPDGVDARVTGPAGIQADIGQVFDGANTRLLLATAGVVAFLLIITYRSPVLWLVPLTVVAVADRLAAVLATRVLDLAGQAWDESTIGILSVLVFGAGTDYALLLISR